MIDDDQPLVQVLQTVDRLLGVGIERGAEPGRYRVEPLRQHAGKLGLGARPVPAPGPVVPPCRPAIGGRRGSPPPPGAGRNRIGGSAAMPPASRTTSTA